MFKKEESTFTPAQQSLSDWTFKASDEPDSSSLAAKVPGSVFTDLMRHGLIKDPFIGANEQEADWVARKNWTYQSSFVFDSSLHTGSNINLVFEGLDTHAEIFLNGQYIGEAKNMFVKYSFDVENLLKNGQNTLHVKFESQVVHDSIKQSAHPFTYPDPRSFSRKAPYQYGWDWGPTLIDIGIWKPVYLEFYRDFDMEYVSVLIDSIAANRSFHQLIIHFNEDLTQALNIGGWIEDSNPAIIDTTVGTVTNTISIPFSITDPALWWPNGLGDAHLYRLRLKLNAGNQSMDTIINFGIRKIELVTEKDAIGESFYFKINGSPVFAKGANYIPEHSFPSQKNKQKTRKLLEDAASVGMNMIRVWGGGIYPDDYFFDLCDSLGLMVWQDFMFACNFYPADSSFLVNVGIETAQQVKRMAGRPSLAMWCGNNEVDEAWHNWGYQEALKYTEEDQVQIWNDYKSIFDTLIPRTIRQFDPYTSYIPTSPRIGWGHEDALFEGDMHYWGVWWGAEPFERYREKVGRFMSEYGFQSFPNPSMVNKFMSPYSDTIDLQSTDLLNHQKHPRGMELIRTYMERDFPTPESALAYIYMSQLVQARGMSIAIDAYRRHKPRCMGTLYWQLNDCWPAISWSSLDFNGQWKAFHHKLKTLYAPVLIIPEFSGDSLNVFLSNDDPHLQSGELHIKLMGFDGKEIFTHESPVSFTSNATKVWQKPIDEWNHDFSLDEVFVNFRLTSSDSIIAQRDFFFLPPNQLSLKPAQIKIGMMDSQDGVTSLTIESSTLVKDLYLIEKNMIMYDDNYFDLHPGTRKTLFFNEKITDLESYKEAFRCLALNPAVEIIWDVKKQKQAK
jgi:beta-mannosidase